MSAPATREEWGALTEELAAFRAGRSVEHFLHAFGVDPAPLRDWAVEDALDTIQTILLRELVSGTPPSRAVASALAMQTQIGVEIGLFLVASGRVQP